MVPVRRRICVNGMDLGFFVRDENGECKMVGAAANTPGRKRILDLCGEVLRTTVCAEGHFPSDEQIFENMARLAVPSHVLGPLFGMPDSHLSKLFRVPPSMIAFRREALLSGKHRLHASVLRGGEA